MARFIIQSQTSGAFLVPDQYGTPDWCSNLRGAGGGVFDDLERAAQLIEDYCDIDDKPVVIDLDVLGTVNDYPDVPKFLAVEDDEF
jgi:hypothetical protein